MDGINLDFGSSKFLEFLFGCFQTFFEAVHFFIVLAEFFISYAACGGRPDQ